MTTLPQTAAAQALAVAGHDLASTGPDPVTAGAGTAGPPPVGAWERERVSRRWLWPWDVYLAVCVVALVALVAADAEATAARRGIAIGLLIALAVSWALIGRRVARDDDLERTADTPAALLYVALVGVLFCAGLAADGLTSFALFVTCPMAFLCLRLRPALVAVTLFNFAPVLVNGVREGSVDAARDTLGIAVLGLAFTVLIGISIVNISRQSAERAELITALEVSRAEAAALSHEAGAAAERTRLAAEIHDTLAQGFTSIVTLVQAAETEIDTDRPAADRHLALAVRTARENLAEARAMVTVLAPADLRSGTLAEVIRTQVARLAEETGIDAACAVDDVPASLPTRVQVVLVRAVQEALTNVRKHAGAASVTVDLVAHDDVVTLTIDDDGTGFETDARAPGYGLVGMRNRVEQLGGVLTVRSAPGAGTTVTCAVPR